ICVHKGEYVQIVAANQDNRWFVHRDANRTSPAAEGWIPELDNVRDGDINELVNLG
ncbi:unnamed protein product, partial [Rotaria sp. Silwood1]